MSKARLFLLGCAAVFSAGASGADRLWIIGGGPTVDSSQASIELNVKWIQDIIARNASGAELDTYFTDGASASPDVVEWHPADDAEANMQPLARVYGADIQNGNVFRNNTVPDVQGGTQADELKKQLSGEFKKLKSGDRAFLIYNGHGSFDQDNTSRNALRLWGESRLSAQDMEKLLSEIDPQATVRVFLPQCFSGGFAHIVNRGSVKGGELASYNRCAFMSVPDDKESEGCTASVNVGDYRDYSTYFFSALDGRTRLGESLQSNPDIDADGAVSLREAHFYALVHADSTDIPRTTSETYLADWEPWYLRWVVGDRQPDNVYAEVAHLLAKRLALKGDWVQVVDSVQAMRQDLQLDLHKRHEELDALSKSIKKIQSSIRMGLENRWPGAISPYTFLHYQFMQNDLAVAQDFIQNHEDYPELVAAQNRLFKIESDMLEIERKLSQLDRLMRLRRLANVLNEFDRFANAQQRKEYAGLVACESTMAW